jgi:DNA polymerase III subunit epsilon
MLCPKQITGRAVLKNLVLERPLAILVLETTGVDPKIDRIIEISTLKLVPGAKPDHRGTRVNPGIPIPAEATEIHGITDADVAHLPPFRARAKAILAFRDGCDLCGFNLVRFDLRLLANEYQRAGLSFPIAGRKLIDPCRVYHQREPRDLSAALRFYCGREHEGAHGAEADALATLAVLDGQLERYQDLPRSVDALHAHLHDPAVVDFDGMFRRRPDGTVHFAKGKYNGRLLADVATTDAAYLGWMLRSDFFEDTKALVSDALAENAGAPD